MAQSRKSVLAGAKRTGQRGKLGVRQARLSGGTDFLIARAGEVFNVPIRSDALVKAACGFQQVSEKPAAKPGEENRSLPTIQLGYIRKKS